VPDYSFFEGGRLGIWQQINLGFRVFFLWVQVALASSRLLTGVFLVFLVLLPSAAGSAFGVVERIYEVPIMKCLLV